MLKRTAVVLSILSAIVLTCGKNPVAPPTAPVITTQPLSQTVTVGDSVIFTVAATGNPTPTYQWLKDGIAISGETSATLSIDSAELADSGIYTVVVSNSQRTVISNPATLTVLPLPPSVPTLVSPADNASGISVNPTLKWNVSYGATVYRVQVYADSAFSTTPVVDDSGLTADSLAVTTALANSTTYYWRVNAVNAGGTSGWSQIWSFRTYLHETIIEVKTSGGDYISISAAVAAADDGDTILVYPGTYLDTIRLVNRHLVIKSAAGADSTVLTSIVPGRTIAVNGGGVTIEGFTFDNALHTSPAVIADNIDTIRIIGCIFVNNTVESEGGSGGGTRGSILRLNSASSANSYCLIQNNVIYHNLDNDAPVYIPVDMYIDILNNLIFDNTATDYCSGLWLRNTVQSKVLIDHVTLYGNTAAQANVIETYSGGGGFVRNCIVYNNTGGIGTAYSVSYSTTSNPLFVDAANYNFHLQTGSIAINTGDPATANDPDGTRADMGVIFAYLPAPFGP